MNPAKFEGALPGGYGLLRAFAAVVAFKEYVFYPPPFHNGNFLKQSVRISVCNGNGMLFDLWIADFGETAGAEEVLLGQLPSKGASA